jgi:NADPH oxidase
MQKKRKLGALRRVVFIWLNRDASSFEWFATLLRQLEDQVEHEGFLSINTYLTSRLSEEQINNIILNDDDKDAITNLKSRTNFGRPDWSQIFGQMRNGIERGTWLKGMESSITTNVGVYYCERFGFYDQETT